MPLVYKSMLQIDLINGYIEMRSSVIQKNKTKYTEEGDSMFTKA